MPVSKCCFTST